MSRIRTLTIGILFLAGVSLAALSPGAVDASPDDPPMPPEQLVDLTTAKGVRKGDGWEIHFAGKAPKLPDGTVLDFSLFWRTHPLRSFELTLDGSKRFSEELAFEDLTGFAEDVYLRAKVDFVRQPREVQEAMEKQPDRFDLESSPWSFKFYPQRFSLGSEEELETQNATVQRFFKESLREALSYEKKFSLKKKAAEQKSEFHKDDVFDSAAWQSFVEKEIRDPLRALQEKLRAEGAGLRLLPHLRDFGYLNEIVNAIARRSYERSRDLYQDLGLSVDPADLSPKDIDINCKSAKGPYLMKTTERLCESQGFPLDSVS